MVDLRGVGCSNGRDLKLLNKDDGPIRRCSETVMEAVLYRTIHVGAADDMTGIPLSPAKDLRTR